MRFDVHDVTVHSLERPDVITDMRVELIGETVFLSLNGGGSPGTFVELDRHSMFDLYDAMRRIFNEVRT